MHIYNQSTKSFSEVISPHKPNEIVFEVGDSKQPDIFHPQFKASHWSNEANLSARLILDEHGDNFDFTVDRGETVRWTNNKIGANLYKKNTNTERVGFELEAVLYSKPKTNVIRFSLQHKNVEFLYQPRLTTEEKAKGAVRPDNVVGSYAVYHSNRSGNFAGGKEYLAGKLTHIYRPHATDANGKVVWCTLHINPKTNTLTVTVPQDFLNSATYPIIVDPTFGTTSIGGSNDTWGDTNPIWCKSPDTPVSDGALTKLTLYCKASTGSPDFEPALYGGDASAPEPRLASSETGPTMGGSLAWLDASLAYASITTGVQYWFGVKIASGVMQIAYDSGSSETRYRSDGPTTWPDPDVSPSGMGSISERISVYGTYSEAGSARYILGSH